jgi:hypothetical protein
MVHARPSLAGGRAVEGPVARPERQAEAETRLNNSSGADKAWGEFGWGPADGRGIPSTCTPRTRRGEEDPISWPEDHNVGFGLGPMLLS